ncbi:MAG: acylneuraminate cytidylyltransferase family protein [Candidatus Magasanikbacteria bacterium]|nr:acylneuraminate cytidylyltransferase family protein [Candidatus Magasanikbacteria bacterium]
MVKRPVVLAIIPARLGSTRIPLKNIKYFLGKPLITYTIRQALQVPFINRVIVDTDSPRIAAIAQRYGAEVPFLRPARLATSTAKVYDSIEHLLKKLKKTEGYSPTHIVLLQTTSPLREQKDIESCWRLIHRTDATTVLTVCPTHPRLYHMKKNHDIILVNGSESRSTNMQAWEPGYLLNGCFVYIVKVGALLKEKIIITKKTKAIVCPKWRSIDLDTPEEWVMAEVLYKNRKEIVARIKKI